jgi:hypothetical protein
MRAIVRRAAIGSAAAFAIAPKCGAAPIACVTLTHVGQQPAVEVPRSTEGGDAP